jgi:hypothetical protein
MKVFTAEGIEKEDNADVINELTQTVNTLLSLKTLTALVHQEALITNFHLGIVNDEQIEELK